MVCAYLVETFTGSQASTGSGNFIKQNTSLFAAATVSGTYTFDFSGLDGNPTSPAPLSIVGEFAASSGVISGGFEDVNDGNSTLPANGAITPGSFIADPTYMVTFGRGTATIANETYAFYIVDSTRVRLIDASTTSGQMLTGDAIAQDNTIPANVSGINSGFAFVIAGSSSAGGITRVGRFTSMGGTLTQAHVDTNNAGMPIVTDISGTAGSIAADTTNPGIPGRFLLTISNGGPSPFTAVLYFSSASSGVIQETSLANGVTVDVADGSIAAQSGSPFTSSNVTGPYAFNWSGQTLQSSNVGSVLAEEDCLGQATATNLSLSGTTDLFEFTTGPVADLRTSGSISMGGDGTTSDGNRNTMSITLGNNAPVKLVVYFVNPQTAFFANNTNETTRISAGVLEAQH
jgi:hypothetical protein